MARSLEASIQLAEDRVAVNRRMVRADYDRVRHLLKKDLASPAAFAVAFAGSLLLGYMSRGSAEKKPAGKLPLVDMFHLAVTLFPYLAAREAKQAAQQSHEAATRTEAAAVQTSAANTSF